jgi:uncharacterized protein (TIGR04255 family)
VTPDSTPGLADTRADLPEFDNPPVGEVAVGVQFLPVPGLQGLALAPLRDLWRQSYPRTQEQAPLVPAIEGAPPLLPQLQLRMVQAPSVRVWFLSDDDTELVQLQPDRLLVNWRSGEAPAPYPRYRHMRQVFAQCFSDLDRFVAGEQLGEIVITQVELSYINVIEVDPDDLGRMDYFLGGWSGAADHHLGQPEQSRLTLVFPIPDLGQPPVRLYVEVNPAQRPNGQPVLFFTLTVRGNPGGKSLDETLRFLDGAHGHLVRSFAELTTESMHRIWQRRR